MKKWIAFALCGIMALAMIACGSNNTKKDENQTNDNQVEDQTTNQTDDTEPSGDNGADVGDETDKDENVEIENPFTEYETVAEAAEAAGVTFTEPTSLPEGYSFSAARAVKDQMIEVVYVDGDNELTIRKAVGTDDCSGDYNTYSETNTQTVDTWEVTCKGEEGVIHLATWTDDTNAYSISASNGLDQEVLLTLVSEMMA